jgi:hypothetical protein
MLIVAFITTNTLKCVIGNDIYICIYMNFQIIKILKKMCKT